MELMCCLALVTTVLDGFSCQSQSKALESSLSGEAGIKVSIL